MTEDEYHNFVKEVTGRVHPHDCDIYSNLPPHEVDDRHIVDAVFTHLHSILFAEEIAARKRRSEFISLRRECETPEDRKQTTIEYLLDLVHSFEIPNDATTVSKRQVQNSVLAENIRNVTKAIQNG